jgi:hypothetical protein
MVDVEQPDPTLLAHREGDEAREFDQLLLTELGVQPLPEGVVGIQPPGDRLGVGQRGLLALVVEVRRLEVQEVFELPLGQARALGFGASLIPAVLAFERTRHVDPAELLEGVVDHAAAVELLPRFGEGPERRA